MGVSGISPLHTNINISERELMLVGKRHTSNALFLGCWMKDNPTIVRFQWTKERLFVALPRMELKQQGGGVLYWSNISIWSYRSILPPFVHVFIRMLTAM